MEKEQINNFLDIVRTRYSCRKYADREVPNYMILKCVEAARLAPSACNKQPWRFVIVKNKHLRQKIIDTALLPGIPMPWLKTAPVIVLIYANKTFITHNIAPVFSGIKYHLIDIGIAGEHFVLAATAQGLGTCWIGWFNPAKVKKILKLDRNAEPLTLISLGFPAHLDVNASQPKKLEIEKLYRIEE